MLILNMKIKNAILSVLLFSLFIFSFVSATTVTDTIGDTSDNHHNEAGEILWFMITASASGTLQSIGINLNVSAGNVRTAIYTNSINAPDTLIAESISTAAINGWNDLPVSTTIGVGGVYWLAFQVDDSSTYIYNNNSGSYYFLIQPYGAFPATASGSQYSAGTTVNMRIIYTEEETTTTTTTTTIETTTTTEETTTTETTTTTIEPTTTTTLPYQDCDSCCVGHGYDFGVCTLSSECSRVKGNSTVCDFGYCSGLKLSKTIGDMSDDDLAFNDYIWWFPIVPSFSGFVTTIGINLKTAVGNARVAIYNNTLNAPDTLMDESSSEVAVDGWNDLNVSTSISAGITYWLAFQVDSGSAYVYYNNSGSSYWLNQSYGAFPAYVYAAANRTPSGITANMRLNYTIGETCCCLNRPPTTSTSTISTSTTTTVPIGNDSIPSGCCPISSFFCSDNTTLEEYWNYTDMNGTWHTASAFRYCPYGCDYTANPPKCV